MERTTNYTMLVHLPDGYKAEQMRDALTAKIKTLPEALRHSRQKKPLKQTSAGAANRSCN